MKRESNREGRRSLIIFHEGFHIDHFGNFISSTYIDLRELQERHPIPLVLKGCQPEHAIENGSNVKISTPHTYRGSGESLIRDDNEGLITKTQTLFDESPATREWRPGFLGLSIPMTRTRTTTTTRTSIQEFAPKGWLFCAAISPETDEEWDAWKRSLDPRYTHVSEIYRPREFARELGVMVAEQFGPQCGKMPIKGDQQGFPSYRASLPSQIIFHGPVVYKDDMESWLKGAESEHELALRMSFSKNSTHRPQREYRFVVPSESTPEQYDLFLEASPALVSAMKQREKDPIPPYIPKTEIAEDESPYPSRENPLSDLEPNLAAGLSAVRMKEQEQKDSIERKLYLPRGYPR